MIFDEAFWEWLSREYEPGKPVFVLFEHINEHALSLGQQAQQKGDTEFVKGEAQGCRWAASLPTDLLKQLKPSPDTDTETP